MSAAVRPTPLAEEVEAIRVLVATMEDLDAETQARVLRYLIDRFTTKPPKHGLFGLPIPIEEPSPPVVTKRADLGKAHP